MNACDNVRDNELIKFGIQIEDREGKCSIWKFDDKVQLLKEREEKLNAKK